MLKTIKQVLSEDDPTPWSGSEATYLAVKTQVEKRWGKKTANEFRASHDARTFKAWLSRNFVVNKGEAGLESFVIIDKKDKNGKVIKKIPKKIWLFHRKQVSPIK
ncbi:MAG TPA: hypothetical protein VJH06_00055 [Candidatus Paceibacterota bacterium]